ncbi:MAG: DUF3303 family protein [candidate division Zixibacteria bacterium]|jgi:hypothetical protein|nr:DUF3303 family protein [candidate division Zixibacteria bacterium]
MLYFVIEHFRNKDPKPVYRRFDEFGRMSPEGLRYIDSWVDQDLARCFQLMETEDREWIDEWIAKWSDLVDFDVIPVMTSREAADRVRGRRA